MLGKGRRRLVTALAVAGGRHTLVDPPLPPTATAMTAPAVYASWWAMTQACSGLTGSLEHIRWYQVPGAMTVPYPGMNDVVGYWSTAEGCITRCCTRCNDQPVIRARHSSRSAAEWSTARGRVSPAAPAIETDDGFFTVTVSVTNTANRPVGVALRDRTSTAAGTTFSYYLQGTFGGIEGGELALDPGVLRFAANETKRHVFDFRVGHDSSVNDLPPAPSSIGVQVGVGSPWTYTAAILNP